VGFGRVMGRLRGPVFPIGGIATGGGGRVLTNCCRSITQSLREGDSIRVLERVERWLEEDRNSPRRVRMYWGLTKAGEGTWEICKTKGPNAGGLKKRYPILQFFKGGPKN